MKNSRYLKRAVTLAPWLLPLAALAQNTQPLQNTTQGVLNVLSIVITIVFVIAVIVFGWGIVKLILAAGDPTEIKNAKQFIWWGIIGIAILASIGGLIRYLQSFFGVDSGSSIIDTPVIN
jgi:hypothetical protein